MPQHQEIRRRGILGWITYVMFLAFNLVMALVTLRACAFVIETMPEGAPAQMAPAIGGAIGIGVILLVWMAGAVILGMLALVTRGRRTIVVEMDRQ